jgi:hypothetical protein
MRLALTLLLVSSLASCRYVSDRCFDFLDPYYVQVGVGTGGGIRVRSPLTLHTGISFGVKPYSTALGWKYGRLRAFLGDGGTLRFDADQAFLIGVDSVTDCTYATGGYEQARREFFLVPALLAIADTGDPQAARWMVDPDPQYVALESQTWVWAFDRPDMAYARLHTLDAEFEIGILAYLVVGYSFGELIDFAFGLLTIDPAGDDGRLWAEDVGPTRAPDGDAAREQWRAKIRASDRSEPLPVDQQPAGDPPVKGRL